jgi:RNA polymerase sigma factor (sigma-70 family)
VEPVSLPTGPLRAPLLRLQSDDRLARLAADGVDSAFELLVRRYRPKLVRSCAQILPMTQAEDAVQQSLLNAHQALRRNGAPERFEPWLHRIAVNATLKELRRSPEDLPLDEERINGVEQPPQSQERRETLKRTIKAIGDLPAAQRQALVLRELEGRSHAEIARSLGLTSGAVRQLIHRARSSVRSAVSALTPQPLLMRLAATEDHTTIAELVGGGAAGAVAGKAVVAALVAGGIASGVTLTPDERRGQAQAAGPDRERPSASIGGLMSAGEPGLGQVDDSGRGGDRGSGSGKDDPSGPSASSGSGSGDAGTDRSGPGGGGSGSSGPSGGGDSSGSGSSGSGTSGGTSGDGTSGDGTSSSGTSGGGTSSSGTSSSGTSGSRSSGSSGSGFSDTSGSGSSGASSEDSGGDELNY